MTKMTKKLVYLLLLLVLLMPSQLFALGISQAEKMFWNSPEGKKVKKELVQKALRTIGKKGIRSANVAGTLYEVFETTYSATHVAMNSVDYINAIGDIISGISDNKYWAVGAVELCHSAGVLVASDSDINGVAVNKSAGTTCEAGATVNAIANPTIISTTGFAKTKDKSWFCDPSADWFGIAGKGADIPLEGIGSSIDVIHKGFEALVDPDLSIPSNNSTSDPLPSGSDSTSVSSPSINQSIVNIFQTLEDAMDTLSDLFAPSGFSLLTRAYLPTSNGTDSYLYYDSEVTCWLGIGDKDAELCSEFFGIEMIMEGHYYDQYGNLLKTNVGSEVCSLSSSDFTYYNDTIEVEGELFDTFGFATDVMDVSFNIELPDYNDYGDLWMHIDSEIIAGSSAHDTSFVPEPSTCILLIFGLGGLVGFKKKFKT